MESSLLGVTAVPPRALPKPSQTSPVVHDRDQSLRLGPANV